MSLWQHREVWEGKRRERQRRAGDFIYGQCALEIGRPCIACPSQKRRDKKRRRRIDGGWPGQAPTGKRKIQRERERESSYVLHKPHHSQPASQTCVPPCLMGRDFVDGILDICDPNIPRRARTRRGGRGRGLAGWSSGSPARRCNPSSQSVEQSSSGPFPLPTTHLAAAATATRACLIFLLSSCTALRGRPTSPAS